MFLPCTHHNNWWLKSMISCSPVRMVTTRMSRNRIQRCRRGIYSNSLEDFRLGVRTDFQLPADDAGGYIFENLAGHLNSDYTGSARSERIPNRNWTCFFSYHTHELKNTLCGRSIVTVENLEKLRETNVVDFAGMTVAVSDWGSR